MEEIKEKIVLLEHARLVILEDYKKWLNYLTEIMYKLVEVYKNEKPRNKHPFLQANLNLFMFVIHNAIKEIRNQCVMRCGTCPEIENEFDIIKYVSETESIYDGFLTVDNLANLPMRFRKLVYQQDEMMDLFEKKFAKFLIKFYANPINEEMAKRAANNILRSTQNSLNLF